MLNSKQRAYLRGLSNKIEPIFQIGKGGVSPEIILSIDEALEARELIKCNVLNNCTEDIKYIASAISERTKSDVVQIIGKKIVLYRKSRKKSIIELP
ncbi:ribosome assembly RNA-binding protein YhbY [uncultured Tyzzerella sp.]|uniref:ribosome assembly RNA-binding protein YhbY n=1 Tax=uncultured Tyzzerella sp. TaxID=2321398 RepID=UPI002943B96D|nr:ribosome assembly RNA-binding protein YhbY [uncultured Tyzzerella sp.]